MRHLSFPTLVLFLLSHWAAAREPGQPLTLEAARWRAGPQESVVLAAGGAPPLATMFLRGEGSQTNLDRPAPDAAGRLLVSPEGPGGTVVGYDVAPYASDWGGLPEGDMAEHWAPPGTALPAAGQRLRRVTCGKIFLRSGAAADPAPSAAIMSKTGQAAELRVYFDPTVTRPGGHMPVRTYIDGDNARGVTVRAWSAATGRTQVLPVSRDAFANIVLDAAGPWRVTFDAVRRGGAGDGGAAGWTWYRAELSFEVPAADAEPGR